MIGSIALFVALATSFVPPDKGRPDTSSLAAVTNHKIAPKDPGPPPPFHPEDYPRYRESGQNVLIGSPTVTTADGHTYPCVQGMYVQLYPSTPYTVWMLEKFFYYVYTTNTWEEPSTLVGAPAYLNYLSKDTVVREGDCHDGTFTITDLPQGTYIAYVTIRTIETGSTIVTTAETGFGPDGPVMISHNNVVPVRAMGDGWILAAQFLLDRPAGTSIAKEENWYVYTHISAGR